MAYWIINATRQLYSALWSGLVIKVLVLSLYLMQCGNVRAELVSSQIRKVIISGIELNIPREFLTMSSSTKPDGVDKALTLAFTYPEIEGGFGDGRDFIQIWCEDIREYKRIHRKAIQEMQEQLRGELYIHELKERKIFNKIDDERNKMIEESIQDKVPFYLKFIFYNNFIQCDPDNMTPKAFCEFTMFYKELYILIRFNKDLLNRLNHIKYCVLKLIKQWEESCQQIKPT
jgi:hypothetical protein